MSGCNRWLSYKPYTSKIMASTSVILFLESPLFIFILALLFLAAVGLIIFLVIRLLWRMNFPPKQQDDLFKGKSNP